MRLSFRLGSWRFGFSMIPIHDMIGVHSDLGNDQHVLMWDFDDTDECRVKWALESVQYVYRLPNIHLLKSGRSGHFIAYCFTRLSFRQAIEIVAQTPGICLTFLGLAILRRKFTLRISEKYGQRPRILEILPGYRPSEATVNQLNHFVKYETTDQMRLTKKKEIR